MMVTNLLKCILIIIEIILKNVFTFKNKKKILVRLNSIYLYSKIMNCCFVFVFVSVNFSNKTIKIKLVFNQFEALNNIILEI